MHFALSQQSRRKPLHFVRVHPMTTPRYLKLLRNNKTSLLSVKEVIYLKVALSLLLAELTFLHA